MDGSLLDLSRQAFTEPSDDKMDKDEACEVMTTDVPNFIINEKRVNYKVYLRLTLRSLLSPK